MTLFLSKLALLLKYSHLSHKQKISMPTTETKSVFTSNYYPTGKKMVIKGPLSNFSRALKANKDKCFQQTSTTWILNDGIDIKKAHGS